MSFAYSLGCIGRTEEFEINSLIKACFLTIFAQLPLVGDLAAQEFVFSDGFEDCSPGQRVYWDGGGDGVAWAGPANWQGDVVPAEGDSVSIPMVSPQEIRYDSSMGARSVRCLDSNRALSVTGGTLEILSTGSVNSSIKVTGGSIRVTGRLRSVVQ